jgi:hypothetical protein
MCEATVKVHGTDEMMCRLPIILRQENHDAYAGGILGLAPPSSYASGPTFVQHLWD